MLSLGDKLTREHLSLCQQHATFCAAAVGEEQPRICLVVEAAQIILSRVLIVAQRG